MKFSKNSAFLICNLKNLYVGIYADEKCDLYCADAEDRKVGKYYPLISESEYKKTHFNSSDEILRAPVSIPSENVLPLWFLLNLKTCSPEVKAKVQEILDSKGSEAEYKKISKENFQKKYPRKTLKRATVFDFDLYELQKIIQSLKFSKDFVDFTQSYAILNKKTDEHNVKVDNNIKAIASFAKLKRNDLNNSFSSSSFVDRMNKYEFATNLALWKTLRHQFKLMNEQKKSEKKSKRAVLSYDSKYLY